MAKDRPDGLIVSDHAEGLANPGLVVDLVAQARLPAMYAHRQFVERGGLMAYTVDRFDIARQLGGYIDRILKGAKSGREGVARSAASRYSSRLPPGR